MEIRQTLRDYIIDEGLDGQTPAGFDDDYDLIESGTLNSMLTMNLVMFLERQYQIQFGINDIVPGHFKTINTLSCFVQTKLS